MDYLLQFVLIILGVYLSHILGWRWGYKAGLEAGKERLFKFVNWTRF